LFLIAAFILISCKKEKEHYVSNLIAKDTVQVTVNGSGSTISCSNRPEISARLVPVASLSAGRTHMLTASAGNKILFVGGYPKGGIYWSDAVPVDVYDLLTNTISRITLDPNWRDGAAIAAVGNKILFAGGGDAMGDLSTSIVDIYDASTNTWTTAGLSVARQGLTAATIENKVVFAGGGYINASGIWTNTNTVDIYDNSTNTWTTGTLSEGRMDIAATTVGSKIYFGGGRIGMVASKTIDIYDAATNTWSTSNLQIPKTGMASITADNKIFWAGGAESPAANSSDKIEIKDLITGVSTFECIRPRSYFSAVKKDNNIVFFTSLRDQNDPRSGTDFEIYNILTKTWSIGKLDKQVYGAAIISVNNTIYVAGGTDGKGNYYNQVWKLEF